MQRYSQLWGKKMSEIKCSNCALQAYNYYRFLWSFMKTSYGLCHLTEV